MGINEPVHEDDGVVGCTDQFVSGDCLPHWQHRTRKQTPSWLPLLVSWSSIRGLLDRYLRCISCIGIVCCIGHDGHGRQHQGHSVSASLECVNALTNVVENDGDYS